MNSPRIWHVGNWCIHLGQKYVESPFEAPGKDVEMLNYAQPFIDALREIPGAEVVSQPSWVLYHLSPEEFDARLAWATTIIFGDVETKCLMLHPDFFTRAKWGDRPLTFPDRFDLLRDWVAAGGHFHMNGGWLSFGGELGKGGWGRSRFRDVFPVECLQQDDLVESTAGFPVRVPNPDHGLIHGIDWSSMPPLLGYNETRLRPGMTPLLEIGDGVAWHPLFVESRFRRGRVSCWMSGVSPHWGINFMKWKHYGSFWRNVFQSQAGDPAPSNNAPDGAAMHADAHSTPIVLESGRS